MLRSTKTPHRLVQRRDGQAFANSSTAEKKTIYLEPIGGGLYKTLRHRKSGCRPAPTQKRARGGGDRSEKHVARRELGPEFSSTEKRKMKRQALGR